jgi:hypothetical protein
MSSFAGQLTRFQYLDQDGCVDLFGHRNANYVQNGLDQICHVDESIVLSVVSELHSSVMMRNGQPGAAYPSTG